MATTSNSGSPAVLARLTGAVQNYAWGSPDLIPELEGRPPTGDPVAEVWFGAHPGAVTSLPERDGQSLLDVIGEDPAAHLGAASVARFGERLPYLVKLLAAAEPLSIQVHPSIPQAVEGCAREDAAGIDRAAPNRSFRDDNHKPELIAALTEFEAMVGFREAADSAALCDAIGAPALVEIRDRLVGDGGIGAALKFILTMDPGQAAEVVDATIAGCAALVDGGGAWAAEADLLTRLAEKYPGDPGVLTAALLNRIVLQPGEAVYLGAGNLHAYVKGLGVEIMANSDNVLRGGLTPKHMDVPALLDVVIAEPMAPNILAAGDAHTTYDTPAPEFALTRYELGAASSPVRRSLSGPEVVLCAAGEVTVTERAGTAITLHPGQAAWAPVAAGEIGLAGDGLVFTAAVGQL